MRKEGFGWMRAIAGFLLGSLLTGSVLTACLFFVANRYQVEANREAQRASDAMQEAAKLRDLLEKQRADAEEARRKEVERIHRPRLPVQVPRTGTAQGEDIKQLEASIIRLNHRLAESLDERKHGGPSRSYKPASEVPEIDIRRLD